MVRELPSHMPCGMAKKKKGKANLFPYGVTSMVGETTNRKVIAAYEKSPQEASKGVEMQSDGEWRS